jgi:dsDNA-specific endonuclease/ATPase MutS2
MTELNKVDRDIAALEQSERRAYQQLGMRIPEEERAEVRADLKIYQQELKQLRDRRHQMVGEATDAVETAAGSK